MQPCILLSLSRHQTLPAHTICRNLEQDTQGLPALTRTYPLQSSCARTSPSPRHQASHSGQTTHHPCPIRHAWRKWGKGRTKDCQYSVSCIITISRIMCDCCPAHISEVREFPSPKHPLRDWAPTPCGKPPAPDTGSRDTTLHAGLNHHNLNAFCTHVLPSADLGCAGLVPSTLTSERPRPALSTPDYTLINPCMFGLMAGWLPRRRACPSCKPSTNPLESSLDVTQRPAAQVGY